jgi:hypothetical protein
MIKIRVKLTIVFCIRLLEASAYGACRDPIAKTNINPKTDLFEKEIEDYGTFRDHMGSLREQAIDGIASPGNLELISDKTDDEIKAAASDLSTIRATDLQVKGQEEVLRTGIMEELHVDYTNPLNTEYQKDASRIADASGNLLKKLTELFKEFGIDCKAVKGNMVIEPEYYIDIKKEQIKDTVYTKAICEEPRNRYKCYDVLTASCKRKGAVGELKYVFLAVDGFVNQLLEGTRRVGYDDRAVLAQLEGRLADMTPYSSVIKGIIGKIFKKTNITVPSYRLEITPKRIYRGYEALRNHFALRKLIQMSVQARTGEWFDNWIEAIQASSMSCRYSLITYNDRFIPLFYYDEGCVEWVDEWDEVCGLES